MAAPREAVLVTSPGVGMYVFADDLSQDKGSLSRGAAVEVVDYTGSDSDGVDNAGSDSVSIEFPHSEEDEAQKESSHVSYPNLSEMKPAVSQVKIAACNIMFIHDTYL
jgi:hypothetical protein